MEMKKDVIPLGRQDLQAGGCTGKTPETEQRIQHFERWGPIFGAQLYREDLIN
jgi:hypothetical protein